MARVLQFVISPLADQVLEVGLQLRVVLHERYVAIDGRLGLAACRGE